MLKLVARLLIPLAFIAVLVFGALSVDGGASAPTWTHCGTPQAETDCATTTTTVPVTTTVPATTTTSPPTTAPPTAPPAPPVRVPPHFTG